MDDDVEIIIPDSLDEPQNGGVHIDFSQVQIQVHGADVAEKILEDCPENLECWPAEYLEDGFDNDIQEFLDNQEPIQEVFESKDLVLKQQEVLEVNNDLEEFEQPDQHESMDIIEIPDTEEYIDVHETNDLTNDLDDPDEFDGVERIPDQEIANYDAVIEDYPDFYSKRAIKEEIEPFMGTDYTDFDANSLMHHDEEELPPEDIYHCNSRIILGSKPCSSIFEESILKRLRTEDESEEIDRDNLKENLNAIVLLEDWRVNLKNSKSFCKDCGGLFATPNALMAHNTSEHSFLVPINKNVAFKSTTKPASTRKSTGTIVVKDVKNSARKSTGHKNLGSKFCNHCNNFFPDHDTLIKHLYELLTVKKFDCKICNAVFKSEKELVNHNVVHVKPETKIEKSTDFKKKLVYEEDLKKKRPVSPKKKIEAIPKSVLFQCPICKVNFMTPCAGLLHLRVCHPGQQSRTKQCKICKRKFFINGLNHHKKQHDICSKFRVYKITQSISEKTLCKCPNCSLHFSDVGMTSHLRSCGTIQASCCQKCNILMPKLKIDKHMKLHAKLKPKDFIIVQYSIKKSLPKRKLDPPEEPTKKIKFDFGISDTQQLPPKQVKIKKEPGERTKLVNKLKFEEKGNKVKLYYCEHCKCCFRMSMPFFHLQKKCIINKRYTNRIICSKCGLQFTTKSILSHLKLHRERQLTIYDIAFYNVTSFKKIIPNMPKYPQCKNCKIKFFDNKVRFKHICGEDYETCNVCGDKFHNSAFEAHTDFHNLIETKKPGPKSQSKLIPELIKKYESLNMMWNIVYSCQKCDIVTDQYDKAVEHSQGHLNNEAVTKNIKCYICNLKYDETCWSKHSELHSQMTINNKDFKILMYNPKKLLTDEWFELFASLPEDQIRQITDKSLYGYERRYKIKLLKEGRSEFTLYCCSDCKVCVRNNEVENHVNGSCNKYGNICKVCSVPFCDISTLKNHQMFHINGIRKEEFRVVMFTKTKISGYKSAKIKNSEIKNKPIKNKIKIEPNKNVKKVGNKFKGNAYVKNEKKYRILRDTGGKYELYKCVSCKVCSLLHFNIRRHVCSNKSLFKCTFCNEFYNIKYKKGHVARHIKQPEINAKTIKIINYYPRTSNDNEEDDFQPTKVKLVTKKSAKKKQLKTEPNKLNKVKIIIKPSKLTKVQSKNIKTGKPKTITQIKREASPSEINAVTTSNSAIVYKCVCGLHYTSLKYIEKHAQYCPDTSISKENCSKCGLLFPTDILVSHLCKHHSKNSKFVVEPYQKESTSKSPKHKRNSRKFSIESTSESSEHEKKSRKSKPLQSRIESTSNFSEHEKNTRKKSKPILTSELTSKTDQASRKFSNCKVKLYKCSKCNVHYINQNTCYKHTYKNHQPVNPNNCIECKLCGLQFTIIMLSTHVSRHHKTKLDLADVLIEEYQPKDGNTPLKIDLYKAADRVQSFQVTSSIAEEEESDVVVD